MQTRSRDHTEQRGLQYLHRPCGDGLGRKPGSHVVHALRAAGTAAESGLHGAAAASAGPWLLVPKHPALQALCPFGVVLLQRPQASLPKPHLLRLPAQKQAVLVPDDNAGVAGGEAQDGHCVGVRCAAGGGVGRWAGRRKTRAAANGQMESPCERSERTQAVRPAKQPAGVGATAVAAPGKPCAHLRATWRLHGR